MTTSPGERKKKAFFTKDLLFYSLMLLFPLTQFALFYIGVNGRSFLYAFQKIDVQSGSIAWTVEPFVTAFQKIFQPTLLKVLGTSFLSFALTYAIGTVLALFFSYFIYKKLPFGNFFKVMLFLPSILSAIVLVTIYQNFVEIGLPSVLTSWFGGTHKGLIENPQTRYWAILFYNVFASFGTSVLMYSNAMSGLSVEVAEAAKIDGANSSHEFFHIVLPGIFPTISTFAITSVAGIFVNQMNLFSFFGSAASGEVQTYGYYLYVEALNAGTHEAEYPLICAIGLLLTLVAVPLTLLTKFALEKWGPSED